MKKVLVSWIGHTDLLAMCPSLTDSQREEVLALLNHKHPGQAQASPVKTLIENEPFDEVHLIDNYGKDSVSNLYLKWINCKATIHRVSFQNPTNYEEIFAVSDAVLTDVYSKQKDKDFSLSLLLTSGTPTMTAVFVLLGKTKFPATFWQTHQGNVSPTRIPYDITVDLLPNLLHKSDSAFHHLSTSSPQEYEEFKHIVGNSQAIRLATGRARRAALRDVSVLLLGESGTGKELFARAIHSASRRKDKPFFAINCAALPSELIESELFGHKKGAFTGADKDKKGAFSEADGGTLFLDEIGECPLHMQTKLLRVLQPPTGKGMCIREFNRVGETATISANVRIIAATNQNLVEEIKSGQFRDDLYYRLAAISIKLPALRERKEDIIDIAEHLLQKINQDFKDDESGYEDKKFSPTTKKLVKQLTWPGNVRQLNNVILQAVVMSEGNTLTPADIEAALADMLSPQQDSDLLALPLGGDFSLDELLRTIRVRYLERARDEAGGSKKESARLLGYPSYQKLANQLHSLDISWSKPEDN